MTRPTKTRTDVECTTSRAALSGATQFGLAGAWPSEASNDCSACAADRRSNSSGLVRRLLPAKLDAGQRLPAGNGSSARTRLRIVGDAREQPAQLDSGRQLATRSGERKPSLAEAANARFSATLIAPAGVPAIVGVAATAALYWGIGRRSGAAGGGLIRERQRWPARPPRSKLPPKTGKRS